MNKLPSGIRERTSGSYEVRVHRNKKPYRLGTYKELSEAISVLENFKEDNKRFVKHGMRKTSFYKVWINMHSRCYNKNVPGYENYGGRGILVCKEWNESFINFYNDMFDSYDDKKEIDRIDNNKGYYKDNCRWTTKNVNTANKRPKKLSSYLPGVTKNKNKIKCYISSIKIEQVKYYIGVFETELEAHNAFLVMHKEWWGF